MNPNTLSPKVTAAAGGGGIGIGLSIILVWILTANGVEVPAEPAAAIGSVLSSALAFIGGYLKRDRVRDVGQQVIDGADGAA